MAGRRKIILLILHLTHCYYGCCEYLRLYEGGKCFWKGLNGTCVTIQQCRGIRHAINEGIRDIEDFQAICAYRGREPIICCRDCSTSNESNTRFNPNLGTLRFTGEKARDQFTEYLDKLEYPCKLHRRAEVSRHIENGNTCYSVFENHSGFQPDDVTYPRDKLLLHTVLLGYGPDFDSAQWLCGGSIISENYILTSANCTSHHELGRVKFIIMGLFDTDYSDEWSQYDVDEVISHPEYSPASKYHDIALLKTSEPIVFDKYVLPSNVYTDGRYDGRADVVAWEAIGNGHLLYETLESVYSSSLTEYGELECSFFYPPQEQIPDGYNHTIQMCFGYKEKPEDPCSGDSGGPLQNNWDASSCGQTVLGVTSMGRTCGQAGGSGLYTRVSYYVPWIESIVWP